MSDNMAMICFKGTSRDRIAAAISPALGPAILSPERDGWICLYQEGLVTCDLGKYGSRLFQRVGAAGMCFKILYSSWLFYWLFDSAGHVIECSDFENELGARDFQDDEMNGVAGGLKALAALGPPALSADNLKDTLRQPVIWRRDSLAQVIRQLGISHVACDFVDVESAINSEDEEVRKMFEGYAFVE